MFNNRNPVIGDVYQSLQGDLASRTQQDLYFEVAKGALAYAGLTLSDVDGLIGDAPEGVGIRHLLPGAALADLIGHPLKFEAMTHIGAAASSAGVGVAAMAVSAGIADVVLVPTAAAGRGWDSIPATGAQRSLRWQSSGAPMNGYGARRASPTMLSTAVGY
ncbi:hypothetical protein [Sphingobium tyrosinilyticum]|uniref:Thiolase N-terminal domain-containing protein n=1 Tax=Sphingobium tyrosinilyticum TaxID=2715436 RepID=A0ABV9EY05_9SPHN